MLISLVWGLCIGAALLWGFAERDRRLSAERRWQALTWWQEQGRAKAAGQHLRRMRETDRRVS